MATDFAVSLAAWAIAAVALGCALQINFGQYDPKAIVLLTVALIAAAVGAARLSDTGRQSEWTLGVLICGVCIQFALLLSTNPLATLPASSGAALTPFHVGIIAGSVFTAIAIRGGTLARTVLALMLLTHLLLGLWALRVVPQPGVDVCVFQREAAGALLHGHNPYGMTFANLYADPQRVYGADAYSNGRLLFGYPYPPLSLLLVLPGYFLGDFRIAHLLATTATGALIATTRWSRVSVAVAALFLFTPRMFFALEAGWTEPLAAMLLAGVVFGAVRGWRVTPVVLALLLVVKQYMILCVPIAAVLLIAPWCRARRREGQSSARIIWSAAAIATAVTVPFALWNVRAFLNSVVLLQFHQPLRMDSLSYLPWLINTAGIGAPTWIAFVAAGVVTVWAALRFPRTPAGFAGASALLLLVFFALSKQAFCNYYFLVIAAMCCAITALDSQPRSRVPRSVLRAEEERPTEQPAMALKD
jgi:hypothetical protein